MNNFAEVLGIKNNAACDLGLLFCDDSELALHLASIKCKSDPSDVLSHLILSTSRSDNNQSPVVREWRDTPVEHAPVTIFKYLPRTVESLYIDIKSSIRFGGCNFLLCLEESLGDEAGMFFNYVAMRVEQGMFFVICGMGRDDRGRLEATYRKNFDRTSTKWESVALEIAVDGHKPRMN